MMSSSAIQSLYSYSLTLEDLAAIVCADSIFLMQSRLYRKIRSFRYDKSLCNALHNRVLDITRNDYNKRICYILIKNSCTAFYHIPRIFITKEMLLIAIKWDHAAILLIRTEFMDHEFLMSVMKVNGMALKYLPYEHKTVPICNAAVAQNPDAILFIL